jgi:hypothetical protein
MVQVQSEPTGRTTETRKRPARPEVDRLVKDQRGTTLHIHATNRARSA